MAMARLHIISFTLVLSLQCAFSIHTPVASPSPSPSPSPLSSQSPDSQSDLPPASFSPPSPAPEIVRSPSPVNLRTLVPVSSPEIASTPSPAANDALPVPVPISVPASADIENPYVDADDTRPKSSSTGRKFGIAFGVIAGVCIIGVGGKVYKKRQDNIRRSRYHYSSREDFL